MMFYAQLFDWRTRAVFLRHARVYLRNWKTAFLPPAIEPLIFFAAFGLGLQGYVGGLWWQGEKLSYPTYVAPGLIAYTMFGTPYYEALYASYVRMFYQKTWDGILGTQVELCHIVWGELLWAAVRGLANGTVVALTLAALHATGVITLHVAMLPLLLPLGFLTGLAFAALALVFTAIVPSIDHMNYPVFLIGIPLSLLSATYFPVDPPQAWLRVLVELNPLYHFAESCRGLLVRGHPGHALWKLILTLMPLLALCAAAAHRLLRRRMLS